MPLGEDDQALDDERLDKGVRAAFLQDADSCARASFYRSVLQVVNEGTGAVSRISLLDVDADPSPVHRPSAESEEIPAQIGRYRVAGEIARGGVGSIYKARDEDLGRDIALKVLLGGFRENADMTRRFMEEAQIGGQLQHPGIVPVHEIGIFGEKHVYFAMKLVKGHTLARMLEERRDPTDQRHRFLGIFEHICQPLAYAHARGVIHRDLKPSNVMVGAFGEVQVMDWGLAKVLTRGGIADDQRDERKSAHASVVQTVRSGSTGTESLAGSVLGTPAYMAPEQARGDVDELDEHSDVFGLGAILCEILTGAPPYTADTAKEMLREAKKANLDGALSRIDACGADQEVIDLAKRCLAVEPKERPRDAGAVMMAIRDHLESIDERARRAEIRAAKVRMRLIVALTVVIACFVGTGAFVWQMHERQERQMMVTQERRERARKATAAVDGVVSEAIGLRAAAEAGGPTDVSAWSRARDAARSAEPLLTEDVDEDTRRALEQVKGEIEAGFRKSRFRARLEDLRDVPLEVGEWPTLRKLNSGYKRAFAEFLGLDVEEGDVDKAVNLVRNHVLRTELLVALREWIQVDYLVSLEQGGGWRMRAEEYAKTQLSQVESRSSPSPTRERLRQFERTMTPLTLDDPIFIDTMNRLDTALLVMLAQAVSMRKDFAAANYCLRLALRREPGNYRVHYALGRLFRRQEKWDEALHHALVARSLRPHRPRPWWSLGLVLDGKGDKDGALDAYTRAVVLDPAEPTFYEKLREFAEREGASEFGDEALARAVSALTPLVASKSPSGREVRKVLDMLLYDPIERSLSAAELLIEEGALWRYFASGERPSPGDEWTAPGFDDSAWLQGASGFGYAEDDDATILTDMRGNYDRVYIRRSFEVPDRTRFRRLTLSLRVDDGCVVYLNGQLVTRLRVSSEGAVENAPEPLVEDTVKIPLENLKEGRNVIAVEGLNISLTSSDFSLIPVLRGELAPRAARERDRERLEEFRELLTGPHAEARLAYLEGRVLQRSGEDEEANEKFSEAHRADPDSVQLGLVLMRGLLEKGNESRLEAQLRELFARWAFAAPVFWDAGLRTALVDRGWTPSRILTLLPPEETHPGWDKVRRFLERLRDGEMIRINCGGTKYVSHSGAVWDDDRFYSGGRLFWDGRRVFEGDIGETEDDSIYTTERWFPRPPAPSDGYHVPLPPGNYRVMLHFAEIYPPSAETRAFDVVIEGAEVLSRYRPAERAGPATADVKRFDVHVGDRVLDIELVRRNGNPKISGIEIQRID